MRCSRSAAVGAAGAASFAAWATSNACSASASRWLARSRLFRRAWISLWASASSLSRSLRRDLVVYRSLLRSLRVLGSVAAMSCFLLSAIRLRSRASSAWIRRISRSMSSTARWAAWVAERCRASALVALVSSACSGDSGALPLDSCRRCVVASSRRSTCCCGSSFM